MRCPKVKEFDNILITSIMLLKRIESKSFHSTDSKNESIHNDNNSGRDAYKKLEKKKPKVVEIKSNNSVNTFK